MNADISEYTYERTLQMEQRNQFLREMHLKKKESQGLVSDRKLLILVLYLLSKLKEKSSHLGNGILVFTADVNFITHSHSVIKKKLETACENIY